MEKFLVHKGLAAPLDRDNVDTDAIIPKQFLKSIHRTGFGENLFDAWRYKDTGEPGMDNSRRPLNPDFVLNQSRYKGASVLVAGKNFGCGSSREHAPWALQQYGFRAVIAPSFADIFFNNSYKNGFLPIALQETEVRHLIDAINGFPGYELVIDLPQQSVTTPDGRVMRFDITGHRKHCLINGLDEIGLTLLHAEKIRAYEAERRARHPYYFNTRVA
ncbi:MAG: 3-isopropylmalate dehydratase small subunit [Burkholderiales bacterium]|nr:3-isopropylmalate dehydratase small subunit [Burkholderiales bacterium]